MRLKRKKSEAKLPRRAYQDENMKRQRQRCEVGTTTARFDRDPPFPWPRREKYNTAGAVIVGRRHSDEENTVWVGKRTHQGSRET